MKKYILILLIFIGLTSFVVHKFFVSIYQINYNEKEKRLEITSRIFIDDLEALLYKKYNQKINLGEENQTDKNQNLVKKYILDNFTIKINGQNKTIKYLSNEIEGNTFICYYNIKNINNIKTIEVQNKCLFELSENQQNIIQTKIYNKKIDNLLTISNFNFFNKY